MIFSELYSAYYNALAAVIKKAVEHPLKKSEIREIIEQTAFRESADNIEPAISQQRWQLIHHDGTTPLRHIPTMPMTTLQKRWLKAIYADPRIRLFTDDVPDFPGVEPLFSHKDILVFDKYSDGDPYDDGEYVKRFRIILNAVKDKTPLHLNMENRKGEPVSVVMLPEKLEYSEKDDKFRVIGIGMRHGEIINLARIRSCVPYTGKLETAFGRTKYPNLSRVEFELTDKRNALERVLLHFAHFEKEVEKLDDDRYKVRISYDRDDETEMVIRILSFGPVIKVTSPQHFVDLIRERLKRQSEYRL